MKIFYWLIILMNITLMVLLWVYIYDLYLQDHLDFIDYPSHLVQSDRAIPIIVLGVLLNTGAIIYFILDFRQRRREEELEKIISTDHRFIENVADQDAIRDLEDELEHIVARLEELRKIHGQKKKVDG
jgi:hypothetical protein